MSEIGRPNLPEIEKNGLYARQNEFIRNFAKGRGLSDRAVLRLMVDQVISQIESENLDIFTLDEKQYESEGKE